MASIHSNSTSQSNIIANPHAPPKPEGSYWQTAAEIAKDCFIRAPQMIWKGGKYFAYSASNPKKALDKIDSIAERGLQRAAVRGVKIEPEEAQRLFNVEVSDESTARNASAVGPVADISPFPSDLEVTRAPDLQARVDDINWKEQMAFHADRLVKKTAAFTTLLQMCSRCGLDPKDKLPLMDMVKKVTEENQGKTLWNLFTERYNLTLIQKLKAGWFYCLYYLTSVITNTVKAYLETAIENLTDGLVKENSDTRSLVFRKFLENVNQFLVEDIRATKDFAFEKEHGDLKDVRDRAIERHYNFSLPELCKAFSNKRVDQDKTTVPILRTLQEIPLIGLIFKAFEAFVNRFIIRSSMKAWVLPYALESTVANGLEATQPHNLPFRLSLTRFLTSRLEQLKVELGSNSPSSKVDQFPGTELLAPTIKNLMTALELEPLKTSLELRKKFQEIEKGKWVHIKLIEKSIQEGILDGGNLLFKYLNETAKSGELFARLLELSCAPFSGEAISEEVLKTELEAEMKKLENLSKDVGKRIVKRAVSEMINGKRPEDSNKVAQELFNSGKTTANKAFAKLKELSDQMSEKINQSAHTPTAENNTQKDIAFFLQIMKAFANQKEIQEEIEKLGLTKMDRDAIWRVMNPLFEKAIQIEERILKLQELQDHYPSHATVENQLKLINDLFKSIREQFHTQPRHLQNPLIQTLGKAAQEISNCLGSKADVARITQQYIKQIADLSESIAKRQKMIDAIYAFYPPRLNEQDVEAEGLLDQLLNYERGIHPPGFKPRACLEEIAKYLGHFPPEEKRELEILIGNGSNLKSKWNQLGSVLQTIYQHHMDLKNRDKVQLDKALDQATQWTQDKILKYSVIKEKDHSKMQSEIRLISQEVTSLQNSALNAQLNISPSISRKELSGSFFSLIAGGAGALLAGPVGAIAGAGVAAAAAEHLFAHPDENNHRPAYKTVAAVAASYALGGAYWPIAAVASGVAGWHAKKGGLSLGQLYVRRKVLNIFTNAYKFCLNDLVPKATATRTLKELS